jgi:hypothetical protein
MADDHKETNIKQQMQQAGSAKDIQIKRLMMNISDKMDNPELKYACMTYHAVEIIKLVELLGSSAPALEEMIDFFDKKMALAAGDQSLEYARIIRALIEKL